MSNYASNLNYRIFIIISILVSLLLSLIFFAFSEWLLQTKIIPHDQVIKRAKIFHQSSYTNMVIGDSRIRDGVNMLPGIVNFGSGSQTYPEIQVMIEEFYENSKEPFKIIIQASVNNFAKYRDRSNRKVINSLYSNDNTNGPYMAIDFYRKNIWLYWKNYLENNFQINYGDARFNPDGSNTEFGNFDDFSEAEKTQKINMLINDYMPVSKPESLKAYKSLNSIFKYLKGKQAQICFVVMPMQKQAKKQFIDKKNVKIVLSLFQAVTKKYDVKYVNYLKKEFPDYFFYDVSHLNEEGAQKLTLNLSKNCFD